jgi:hypothetical protein
MQFGWIDKEYVFGRGSVCELTGRGTIELVPFVGSDGSGEVVSHSLYVDGRFQCRIAGEMPAVQAEAERIVRTRFPKLFQEAAA